MILASLIIWLAVLGSIWIAQAQLIPRGSPYLVYGWVSYPNSSPAAYYNVSVNLTNRSTLSVICTLYNDTSPAGEYSVNLDNCPSDVNYYVGDFVNVTARNLSLGWMGINNSTLVDGAIGELVNNVSVCYTPITEPYTVYAWVLWPNGTGIQGALVQMQDLNVSCYWSTTTASDGSWSLDIDSCECRTGELKHIVYPTGNPTYPWDQLYYNASWQDKCFNQSSSTRGTSSPQKLENLTLGDISLSVDPRDFYFGIIPLGRSSSTSGGKFNVSNQGNCMINISANATNTSNWRLVITSPAQDEFRLNLSYYRCPQGAICSNATMDIVFQDVFMLVPIAEYVLFDLKFETPTASSTRANQTTNLTLRAYLP